MQLGNFDKCQLDFINPIVASQFLTNFAYLSCDDMRAVASKLKLLKTTAPQPAPVTAPNQPAQIVATAPQAQTTTIAAPVLPTSNATPVFPVQTLAPNKSIAAPAVSQNVTSNNANNAASDTIFGINKTLFYVGVAALVLLFVMRSKK